jgi:SAM-dependent methyltransferase
MAPHCRICRSELSKVLLELENVPAAAQRMPATPAELAADKGVDLTLYQCPACGVLQHTAPPVPYFREVLRASGVSGAMKQFRLEQFSDWVSRYGLAGKKVFEAGCGRGEYLSLMARSGVSAVGVEYGPEAVEFCRTQGLDAVRDFFETGDEKLPGAPFDGFFVLNFLEHIPDLPAFLRGIRNNLRPGAAGLVEVPNLDMILRNSLLTEFSTEHIYSFTAETLTGLLQNSGFTVRSCRSVWHDYILSAEVLSRRECDLSGCAAVRERLERELRTFLARHRKTAFWGAGHQALTTLALCGMTSEKICFVVDSSPEKQGRFTYATHIPVVSPDRLAASDADSVIIACGGYSDEVVSILRSRFPGRFAPAVLREITLEILR